MNKMLIICLLILELMALSACNSSKSDNIQNTDNDNAHNDVVGNKNIEKIFDIQKTENVGKTVTVQGKVINTLQSARYGVSGYKIQDSTGTIDVSSKKIPQVNATVTVTGTLIQTRFFGIVINETE
jgi:uncharacterized protein YdeI (BOF family)